VVINVSLPPVLAVELDKIVARLGFKGPSDYFQASIRYDAGLNLRHEQTPVQPVH
jgi:hypothetical protein